MYTTYRRALARGVAAFAVVLVVGCGSSARTSVTQLWKAPVARPPMKSIVVFAAHMDEANRRALEDAYVAALALREVTAKPSYAIFPGDPPQRDQAREVLKKAGLDGILVSTLRSVRERQTYVPGYNDEGGFWAGYYGPGWATWSPGYTVTDEIVDVDTTLWDTRYGDQLAFAVTTRTTNPSSGKSYIPSVVNAVASSLDKEGFLPPKRVSSR
jgi:hypothetical protein